MRGRSMRTRQTDVTGRPPRVVSVKRRRAPAAASVAAPPEWSPSPRLQRPFESFRYLSSSESVERMTVASLSSAVCSVSIDFQNS